MSNKVFQVTLKNVTLNYPFLHKKRMYNGIPFKYEAVFLMDKDTEDGQRNYKHLKKNIQQILKISGKNILPEDICLKDGDKGTRNDYINKWYIKGINPNKPILLDDDGSLLPYGSIKLYAGCIVNTHLNLWLSNSDTINASLRRVQFVRDGIPRTNNMINYQKI